MKVISQYYTILQRKLSVFFIPYYFQEKKNFTHLKTLISYREIVL